jgi:hypothetical protein
MRRTFIVAMLLALFATGCTGESSPEEAAPSSVAPPESTKASPSATVETGESVACQLGATKWVDRINKHATDAIMGTAVIATTVNIDNLNDTTSRIKVLCSEELASMVLEANYEIALVNAKLRVCELSDGVCGKPESRTILKSTDKIAELVGSVNDMVQQ